MGKIIRKKRQSGELNNEKKAKIIKNRHTLRRQITAIFVLLMALTIGAVLLVFNLFSEKIYLNDKVRTLTNAYTVIDEATKADGISAGETDEVLQSYANISGISIVIINSIFEPIKVYSSEPQDRLIRELTSNIGLTVNKSDIIINNDSYVLFKKYDSLRGVEYLEMVGVLSDDSFFMMRIAMESIRNSVEISNRFLLYIGLGSMIISSIIIYFVTKRISKPILEIAEISEKVSNMDFDAKYKGKDKTEIGVLGESINKMSNNLEASISQLKAANLELIKDIDEKKKVDEMRKDFISSVSHELKTPLALIQGYAEGLKECVNDEEDRDYYCDIIIDEAGKMNTMVKNILSLNQLEAGMDSLNIEHFDIVSLVNNYIKNADIIIKQNEARVVVAEHEPIYVWADEFKIEEVFMNYFSNAINHLEGEKRIDVYFEIEENRVKVNVYNTGKPIPDESIDYIWDKFYKVDKARTREYGGSGVGLSIVKAIMDAHNEQCGVLNKEDGVCFYFTLDCANK